MSLDTTIRNSAVLKQFGTMFSNRDFENGIKRYIKSGEVNTLAVSNGRFQLIDKNDRWEKFLVNIGFKTIIADDEVAENPITKNVKVMKECDPRVKILSNAILAGVDFNLKDSYFSERIDSKAHKMATANNMLVMDEHKLATVFGTLNNRELAVRDGALRIVDVTTAWNRFLITINWISVDPDKVNVIKEIVLKEGEKDEKIEIFADAIAKGKSPVEITNKASEGQIRLLKTEAEQKQVKVTEKNKELQKNLDKNGQHKKIDVSVSEVARSAYLNKILEQQSDQIKETEIENEKALSFYKNLLNSESVLHEQAKQENEELKQENENLKKEIERLTNKIQRSDEEDDLFVLTKEEEEIFNEPVNLNDGK